MPSPLLLRSIAAIAALCFLASRAAGADDDPNALMREIHVPLSHEDPDLGTIPLKIVLAHPFDPQLPTVLVIQDAQQFFLLAEGAMSRLEQGTFGDGFNLVGVVGRGFSPDVASQTRRDDGSTDWTKAYRVLCSRQWIEDIDQVRRELVGADGKVALYGVSGGGFLVHEYLSVHADTITRAVTVAAPIRPLDAWLRLNHDHFWNELQDDPPLAEALSKALAARPDRAEVIEILQRQHFFVPTDDLPAERRKLIQEIVARDENALKSRKEAYQVNAIQQMLASDVGIGIRVRMYEFVAPVLRYTKLDAQDVLPNIENEANIAAPLLELNRAGVVPDPPFDRHGLHRVTAEVLVIAGRHDQTADYRAQIAATAHYPHAEIFLADDNHMSMRLTETGARQRLITTFLRNGSDSPQMEALLREIDDLRWKEH